MPPRVSDGNFFSQPSSPTFLIQSWARSLRSERAVAAKLEPKGDIVEHVQVRQQGVFLIYESAFGGPVRAPVCQKTNTSPLVGGK